MTKKVSLPEGIIFGMLNAGADALDITAVLTAAVPIVGQILIFMSPIVGFCVWASTQCWLIMKGGLTIKKQISYLIGGLLDEIPFLNALPLRTVTLLITIYLINKTAGGEQPAEEPAKAGQEEEVGEGAQPAEA